MPKKKSTPLPPVAEIHDQAISAIRRTSEPVTAKQVCGLLASSFKMTDAVLTPILGDAVANQLLNAIPAATAKGKVRYWDRSLFEFSQLLIEQTIQKKGPQSFAKLKTAVKGLSEPQLKQALKDLIEARRVHEHPLIGKSKTVNYGTSAPAIDPYLKDVGTQLTKIVKQLLDAGVDNQKLTETLVSRLKQAGLGIVTAAAKSSSQAPEMNELDLLMLMRQIEPGADRGALVTARELRRAANSDKAPFDQAVLNLARQGHLMLHRHDYANGLSSSERDELVTDGAGTYYVGMALRRSDS